jgi:hypothetical protein
LISWAPALPSLFSGSRLSSWHLANSKWGTHCSKKTLCLRVDIIRESQGIIEDLVIHDIDILVIKRR